MTDGPLTEPQLRTLEAVATADSRTDSWVNFAHLGELAARRLVSVEIALTPAGREVLSR